MLVDRLVAPANSHAVSWSWVSRAVLLFQSFWYQLRAKPSLPHLSSEWLDEYHIEAAKRGVE